VAKVSASRTKRPYSKPVLELVQLRIEETGPGETCKTGNIAGPGSTQGNCSQSATICLKQQPS
jgi:hypothetical protein